MVKKVEVLPLLEGLWIWKMHLLNHTFGKCDLFSKICTNCDSLSLKSVCLDFIYRIWLVQNWRSFNIKHGLLTYQRLKLECISNNLVTTMYRFCTSVCKYHFCTSYFQVIIITQLVQYKSSHYVYLIQF
jgi:hypothetical protein